MDTPLSHDLRVASIDAKRDRTRAEKYYSFRYVKPGQLNQPHYRIREFRGRYTDFLNSGFNLSQSTHANTIPVEYFTPKRLYQEAQAWPRPPTYHHRHADKCRKEGATNAYSARKKGQRDLGKAIRRAIGPEQEWRDDDAGWMYGHSTASCSICLIREDDYEDAAWQDEINVAGIIESHGGFAGQTLVEEALEKWDCEQAERLDINGWSVTNWPEENFEFESDYESGWEILDP